MKKKAWKLDKKQVKQFQLKQARKNKQIRFEIFSKPKEA